MIRFNNNDSHREKKHVLVYSSKKKKTRPCRYWPDQCHIQKILCISILNFENKLQNYDNYYLTVGRLEMKLFAHLLEDFLQMLGLSVLYGDYYICFVLYEQPFEANLFDEVATSFR